MPHADAANDRVYITTPIYYVNDRPHIGHIYTTTVCDVFARFARLTGRDVFFLTGTDEHGLKVEKSAQARGIGPQALADENAAEFQRVLSTFDLTNDDFIRTTYPYHEAQVQLFVQKLLESGTVYLGEFEGWYDEGQEEYYTETKAKDLNYQSPISKKPLARAKEKNYYFRLSAFQKLLEDFFAANPGFVRPEARRNEVLGRLREGLQDVPVSRTNFSWGIPMPAPAEPGHVIYVWIDALFNYITALGLGAQFIDSNQKNAAAASNGLTADTITKIQDLHRSRAQCWPAAYHVIGKEILWFHAVIWPAMLMALGIPTPKCVYAHSFWISEGQKMSKSLGNFIDLEAIQRYLGTYGPDAWRYYLITQGPLGSADADFAAARFHSVYEKDLVSTVGNCASRVTAMINRYCEGMVPAAPSATATTTGQAVPYVDWASAAKQAVEKATKSANALDLPGMVDAAMELIRIVDGYINATEPFKLAKHIDDPAKKAELDAILFDCIEAVRIASIILWPVLPQKMEELWKAISLPNPMHGTNRIDFDDLTRWAGKGSLNAGTKVQKVALFPRVEQSPAAATA